MSYGKMNTNIDIISTEPSKMRRASSPRVTASSLRLRQYKEVRNTTAKWERIIGNAAFSSVTAVFRFRKIPGLTVTTSHFISEADGRYNIVSAEDVRGRGMYVEVLAEKLEGTVR
jgi:hypothetical protein